MSHSSRSTNWSHRLWVLAFVAILAISIAPFTVLGDQPNEPPWTKPTDPDSTIGYIVPEDTEICSDLVTDPTMDDGSFTPSDGDDIDYLKLFLTLIQIM